MRKPPPTPPSAAELCNEVVKTLQTMKQDDREEFFDALRRRFCLECGSDRLPCNCLRDE